MEESGGVTGVSEGAFYTGVGAQRVYLNASSAAWMTASLESSGSVSPAASTAVCSSWT